MHSYTALPDGLTIKESSIHGHGVFASSPIDLNYAFGITHVVDSRFQDGYIRTPLGGFINHSETPNCEFTKEGDTITFKTLRQIKVGEELTAKYWLYTDFN